ncbi:Glutaredoxin [Parelaphostrongylus tenuis]|uniref:Glutaredoxin n=1 Tax=Parelaphostrongylus tenuis TaxID=148309 RepID=A0AAD5MR33_PARTN|nr:Glutaredoxin [Parelaphostrongylus tenuis]
MGSVKSKVDVDTIHTEVTSAPVMIYTKDGCSFCTKAKELLNNEKIEECNTDELKEANPQEYKPRINGLVYVTRQTTMPQIFICGKFIGGFTDLEKLQKSRELYGRLAECTAEDDSEQQRGER